MTVKKITALEGELLNVLYEISPLEWRRFQQRYPELWVDGHFEKSDRSGYPPYVSFRFVEECPAVVQKLRQAVGEYSGKISWQLINHKRDGLPGVNWTIAPSRLWEINEVASALEVTPAQYLATYEPAFGPAAYDDMEGLTRYIRQIFSDVL